MSKIAFTRKVVLRIRARFKLYLGNWMTNRLKFALLKMKERLPFPVLTEFFQNPGSVEFFANRSRFVKNEVSLTIIYAFTYFLTRIHITYAN